ncbi:SPASM domain-containing protein [Desulfovibrio mangrovi]|uniref:radical SAM/SPASM domain-containing protein n=1 Tax=Desulfovibrio mangrovi TaxID=2976983 RepID=UPI0022451CA5|nr:radical SAM/SPASM domain-containing protein [Desulfovibrio mangrovi]UZP67207.1 SPASM domain-containing protein [Desulfovibrio mangrovi]
MRFSLFSRRPRWQSVQVEVSTLCRASCIYCPRTALRQSWRNTLLPMSVFRSLLPSLARVRHVHLQGWGEPLLHPDLSQMVALARQQGCTAGTTTCGLGVSDEQLAALVNTGLDVMAFSLAGGERHHNALRPSTPFTVVLDAMARLKCIKEQLGSPRPHIHIAWLSTVSAVEDVCLLPDLMEEYGIHEATVSGISLVADARMYGECFASLTQAEFRQAIRPVVSVLDAAFEHGLSIHARLPVPDTPEVSARKEACPPPQQENGPVATSGQTGMIPHGEFINAACPEPVQHSLVITAEGKVTPCILGCLPDKDAVQYTGTGQHPLPSLEFGNVAEASLETIWASPAYRQFRKQAASGILPAQCTFCHARQVCRIQGGIHPPGDSMTERLEFLRQCAAAEQ